VEVFLGGLEVELPFETPGTLCVPVDNDIN
jgi:hypothetical protein